LAEVRTASNGVTSMPSAAPKVIQSSAPPPAAHVAAGGEDVAGSGDRQPGQIRIQFPAMAVFTFGALVYPPMGKRRWRVTPSRSHQLLYI
jgi:hypothetical protein